MSEETARIQAEIKQMLADSDVEKISVTMPREIASMFVDFLYDWDPDMPPRPIAKVLGPLLSDVLMNRKLARLDELVDALGPISLRFEDMVSYLETRRIEASMEKKQK
jgi:hypothetical protein